MRVLLATDGSECSRKAIAECSDLVSLDRATGVKVISVVGLVSPIVTDPFNASREVLLTIEKELKIHAVELVNDVAVRLAASCKAGVEIEKDVLFGDPKNVIVEEAAKWNADLVVVGSHGYGFMDRMFIGTVSDFVVHHAPCSVVVVRSEPASSEVQQNG